MSDPRYFLITVGVGEYDRLDDHHQLPSAGDDVRAITELFCAELGYDRVLQDVAPSPRAAVARERLAAWLTAVDRREDDRVVIYWSGHGEVGPDGRHYLLARDFDGQNYLGQAVATEDIGRMIAGTPLRHLLLMIDTCYAGSGVMDLAAIQRVVAMSRPEATDQTSGIYLVAASRPRETAREGLFVRMFIDAVNAQRHGGWRQPFLDPHAIVGAINKRMTEERTRQQVMINIVDSGGAVTPVIRNPRHDERVPDGIAVEDARRLLKRPDLLAHWSPRARGVGLETESGDLFEGREAALRALVAWLDDPVATGQRIVTGGPGSGKSAVLARLALMSDRSYRSVLETTNAAAGTLPKIGAIDVAIHARGKTVNDVLTEVADGLDTGPVVSQIVEAAADRSSPPTILVDAVDEALEPRGLARELLRPLAESRSVKLVIGTRKHVIPSLGALGDEALDLDDESRWFASIDVERYVNRLLCRKPDGSASLYAGNSELRKLVAVQVARRAGATFLIARLVARSLSERDHVVDISNQTWISRLPRTVGEAFEEWLDRFGPDKQRVRDLLRPLAYANGGGLPWENIWPPAASAISGKPYGDGDVEWLLEVAGAFVIETRQTDRSAYRLFHEALAEHLRSSHRDQANQARITTVLRDSVSIREGKSDWFGALPYVRWHMSTHAADGDAIESLVEDPAFLIAAEPTRLMRALSSSSAPAVAGARGAYRGAFHLMQGTSRHERASYLELYAQRHLVDDLATRISARFKDRPWRPRWSKLRADSEHFVPGTHDKFVLCVAATVINGRAVAASGGTEDGPRLWDLDAGAPIGRQPTRRASDETIRGLDHRRITTVDFTSFQGEPVLISRRATSYSLNLWDPETGLPVGDPVELARGMERDGDNDSITWRLSVSVGSRGALAVIGRFPITSKVADDQRVVLVTCADSIERVDSFLNGKDKEWPDGLLRCGDEVFVLLQESDSRQPTVHDMRSGDPVGPGFGPARVISGGIVADRPAVAFIDSTGCLEVRDLKSGRQLIRPVDCEVGTLSQIQIGVGNGVPIAVVAGTERAIRVIDLETGTPVGGVIAGHTAAVTSLAIGLVDDRTVIISGGDDRTVRVWDFEAGLHTTAPRPDYPGGIRSVAIGQLPEGIPVVASAGRDANLRLMQLENGRPYTSPSKVDGIQHVTLRTSSRVLTAAVGTSEGLFVQDLVKGRFRRARRFGVGERCRGLQISTVNGQDVFVAGRDRQVWVYGRGAEPKLDVPTTGHEGGVTALAVAEGNGHTWALSGGGEGSLLLWNLSDGTQAAPPVQAHEGHVTAVALSDLETVGVAVSAGSDGHVRTWDVRSLEPFGPALEGHSDWVRAVAVGSLGHEPVIVTGGDDYSVRLWAVTGEPLRCIELSAPVRTVAMYGATVVVGADDGMVAIDLQ